jgi:hypothetical protein
MFLERKPQKLLQEQVKDINLAPEMKISTPEKEEKGDALTSIP